MAKKGKGTSKGFFGAICSLLGSIPAVKSAKKAAGKAFKKQIKKAKNKLKLKNLFKKLKKNFKKKRGKVFTKARKLKNKLTKRKLSKKFKKAVKKAVLVQKKADKRATTKAGKASKAAVKQVKKYEKAQNLKLVSMGLNCIPVFGNIKTLYEMATGRDMITGQKLETPQSKYINLENSCPVPRNEGKTKKEKDLELIEEMIKETNNERKELANFFFGDIKTILSPHSTWGERAYATLLTFYKPAKIADLVSIVELENDKAKNIVRGIPRFDYAKKEEEKTGDKGTGNTNLTEPSLPNGSKPKGEYTKGDSHGVKKENETADFLANKGYEIKMLNEVNGGNGHGIKATSNPDFLIEGKVFDCYSPTPNTKTDNVLRTITNKTKTQAERIVLNVDNFPPEKILEITEGIQRKANPNGDLKNLKELLIVNDGKITRVFGEEK